MTAPAREPAYVRPVAGWVPATAVAGTVLIALGAFWLSFTALADLAERSGIDPNRAWVWPLIVDGVIVVATISVVALDQAGPRATRYPWLLLALAAAISVTANALHAGYSRHPTIPEFLAAAVSAIPPLVLLAITHLTVALTRHTHAHRDGHDRRSPADRSRRPAWVAEPEPADPSTASAEPERERGRATRQPHRNEVRQEAARLHELGWTNRRIAAELGVHPSTVGRWIAPHDPARSGASSEPSPRTGEPPARARAPPTAVRERASTGDPMRRHQ